TLSNSTLNNFYLYNMNRQANDLLEKNIDTYINFKIPFNLGDYISAYVKFGIKYKETSRDRNFDSKHAGISVIGDIPQFGEYATKSLPWAGISTIGTLSMVGLYDYAVSNFLKGQYNFNWYPNITKLNQIFDWWNNFSNYYLYNNPKEMPPAFSGGKLGFYPDWYGIKMNTQKMNDYYYAGYIMSEFNLGDMFVFIPGIRYEKVKDNLNGWWIEVIPYPDLSHPSGHAIDSTHNDEYLLPNFHLKFKPTDWIQTLFSFTQTLNRPDYNMLIPNVYLNRSGGTEFYQAGNPDLKPEFWTNYDAQVAVFGDKIGLVSIGGFYKKVKDMIWTPSIYRTPGQPWSFGAGQYFTDNSTVLITVPQNFNFPVYLKGLELEAQTNLWYLPQPFNYISLDINFTLINSKTTYEYSKTQLVTIGKDSRGRPITKLISIDSIYSGPMLNQPKSIANFSFGYNYKGFNLWLSYQYTGEIITSEPNMVEFEVHKSNFSRWDLQVTQKLPVEGLEVLFNFANINNPVEYQNNLADPRPSYLENYGWTMDFGIRYKL
ncbi:MAG: TonB-dependent receptor, partial [Bacteroidetes bacterium]|nr:TonB-dependent receptor [Bacteroidota bacterium]